MIETLLVWIEAIVLPYGAWGIFIASILEELVVPIPSTLVQMGGGFLLMEGLPVTIPHIGRLFLLVVVPATLGLTIGSLAAFLVGKYVGKEFFQRFGRYIGITWEEIENIAEKMKAKGSIFGILVFVRSIPVMPASVASAAAGLLQLGIWQYIIATILGTLIRATVLGFVGWELGAGYKAVAPFIERFEKIGLIILLLGILYWWFAKKMKKPTPVAPPAL